MAGYHEVGADVVRFSKNANIYTNKGCDKSKTHGCAVLFKKLTSRFAKCIVYQEKITNPYDTHDNAFMINQIWIKTIKTMGRLI